jgi:hypothetical protein
MLLLALAADVGLIMAGFPGLSVLNVFEHRDCFALKQDVHVLFLVETFDVTMIMSRQFAGSGKTDHHLQEAEAHQE